MYPHQADRLTAALESAGAAALVATTPENVRYVTGFASLVQRLCKRTEIYGVFTPRGTALVVPGIDAATVADEAPAVDHVRCYGAFAYAPSEAPGEAGRRIHEWMRDPAPTAADALAGVLAALGAAAGTVALDEDGLTPPAWTRLAERLAPRSVRPGAGAFATARMVKGPYEIECLQRALAIAEEAVNEVIQMLNPGVTERDAEKVYEAAVASRGGGATTTTILAGERSAYPAAAPSDRALRKGDLVRFDVGAVWKGYHADLGRTAVAGEPDARQERAFTAIEAGLEAIIDGTAPGVPAARLFDAAVEAARGAGLAAFARHHVGHGIGLAQREPPLLARGETTPLEAGMVLRVETPYYEPGWGGLHLKDTLLVVRGGARALNHSHRGLVVLD